MTVNAVILNRNLKALSPDGVIMTDTIEQCNNQRRHNLEHKTCEAVGCRTNTNVFMCGAHYRFLPKEIKVMLTLNHYDNASKRKAVETLAAKENIPLSATDEIELTNRYGRSSE